MFRRKSVSAKPPRRTEAEIDKDLELIYAHEGGQETDFTKLEVGKRPGRHRLLVWLLVTLAVVSAAAYGGYLVFERAFSGSGETLALAIDGPDTVSSGEQAQYDVRYQNIGRVPLANLEITLNLPEGFLLTSVEPSATQAPQTWQIGSVTPGSDGMLRLKGVWIDAVPSGQKLQALASYRPANFSSDFQDITTKLVSITESVLILSGEGQASAVAGEQVTYTYTVKNTGLETMSNLRLRVAVPEGFLVGASDPDTVQEGQSEWALNDLPSQAEQTVTLSGAFAGDVSGLQTVQGSIGVFRDETYLVQASADTPTDVVADGLTLRVIVNGSSEDQSVDPGSNLRLSIDVINGSEEAVSGLSVALSVEPSAPINWQEANLDGASLASDAVRWRGGALAGGGIIKAKGRETIDASLPLDAIISDVNQIVLSVSASVDDAQNADGLRVLTATPLTLTINSDTRLATGAYYYDDGTVVGSGPLPPTAGQTTGYRLVWQIDNSLHPLDEVVVSATIPPSVSYDGVALVDIGQVQFDSTTRVLSWTIDRLPTSVSSVAARVDLSVTPSASDVGTFVKLTNAATLTAIDSQTSARISAYGEIITTELPDDADASGKGAVVE